MSLTHSHRRAAVRAAASLAAVALLSNTARAATDTYVGPATGSYSAAANWSLGVVPNNGGGATYDVVIDARTGQASTVQIQSDINPTIGNLTVNAGDALQVGGNIGLTIVGTSVTDNGQIVVNYNQYYTSALVFNANTTLSGTGALLLNSGGSSATVATGTGNTLTQAAGHTIAGFGLVSATLANAGTVNGNAAGNILYVRGATTNTGLIQGTASGVLQIDGGNTIANAGGTMQASGGSVNLYGSTISGGTVRTTSAAGSGFNVQNGTFAGGVTVAAGSTVNVNGNSDLSVTGTALTNNGTVVVNNNQYYTGALTANGNVTVGGTGTITLNSGGSAAQLDTGAGYTLTLGSGQTVDGLGQINATAVNQGTVNADVAGQVLYVSSATANNVSGYSLVNTGTLKATAGTLRVDSGATVNNAGGTILASGGTVQLFGVTVNGGTLTSTGGGSITVQNSTFTGGPNISAGTVVNLNGNTNLSVAGPTLANNGTVVVNNNQYYTSALTFTSSTTVTGAGAITLAAGGSAAQLNTNAGATLTLAAGQAVNGYGQVNALFVNNGTVNASVTSQSLNVNGLGGTNNGTMEATNGGTLAVNGVTIAQGAAGVILATGNGGGATPVPSAVSIVNATVSGGTLSGSAADVITIDNSTLTGSPTISPGTRVNVDGNTNLTVTGTTLTDNGLIVLNQNRYYASALVVNSNLTLAGTGTLTLASNGTNAQVASGTNASGGVFTLTQAAGHTIDGYGQVNALLVNSGTVNADVTSQSLTVAGYGVTNNATMQATNGGTLYINGTTVAQGAGGVIQATGNSGGASPVASHVTINGATVSGGTLAGSAADFVTADNSTFTGGLTIATGTLVNVDGNTNLTVTGATLTDNGHIVVNQNQYYGAAFQVNSNLSLGGTGTLTLNSNGGNAQLNTGAGFTLTQGQFHAVDGFGQVNATLVNNGVVSGDVTGQTLAVNGTTTNNGRLLATNGGTLTVAAGVLTNLSGTTLTGGQYEADANSTLVIPGTVTANGGGVTLSGVGSTFDAIAPIASNSGGFTLLNGRTFTTVGPLANSNVVTVGYGSALTVSGSYTQTGGLTTASGTLTVAGATAVTGGQLLFNPTQGATRLVRPLNALTVSGGGTVTLAATASATRTLLSVASLTFGGTTVAPTGKVDVGNNDALVHNGNLTALTAAAAAGFAGGTWNGSGGIASATAAADARHLTAVGVISNGVTNYATFDGQPAVASDVLVRFTYYGDANLDGSVTAADYTRLDAGAFNHLTGWANGDFNYDGVVDGSDYALADNAFNQQAGVVGTPAAVVATPAAAVAAVPEPATAGGLAVAGLLLGRRRRSR